MKRIYENPDNHDGYRVLVDRLWPRGMSKQRAELDEWDKDVTPSPELRTWFGHRAERFEEFASRYMQELDEHREAVDHLLALEQEHGTVTLLYAAKDPQINHVQVLMQYLHDSQAHH